MPAVNANFIDTDKDKQALRTAIRRQVRQARQALSPLQQQQNAAALVEQSNLITELNTAQHIALYLSNDGELDTAPLLAHLQKLVKPFICRCYIHFAPVTCYFSVITPIPS